MTTTNGQGTFGHHCANNQGLGTFGTTARNTQSPGPLARRKPQRGPRNLRGKANPSAVPGTFVGRQPHRGSRNLRGKASPSAVPGTFVGRQIPARSPEPSWEGRNQRGSRNLCGKANPSAVPGPFVGRQTPARSLKRPSRRKPLGANWHYTERNQSLTGRYDRMAGGCGRGVWPCVMTG